MSSPAISVLVPFKDTGRYFAAALHSLSIQTMTDFEVVMVDDGSTDNSREIAEGFCQSDKRFKVFNGGDGLIASLNVGLTESTGKWIARFDSDDLCHPKRLSLQLAAAEKNGDKTVISCRIRSFPHSEVSSGYRQYESWINGLESSTEIEHSLFVESPIPHPTAFYNRRTVIEAGGYRNLGLPEDYELWLRLWSLGFKFLRIPRTLLAWRERDDRFSRTSSMYSLTAFYRTKALYLGNVPSLHLKNVFIAGTGQAARRLGKELQRQGFQIEAFLSPGLISAKRELRNRPVISVTEWENLPELPVIVATRKPGAVAEIRKYFESRGLLDWKDFVLCT